MHFSPMMYFVEGFVTVYSGFRKKDRLTTLRTKILSLRVLFQQGKSFVGHNGFDNNISSLITMPLKR